MSDTSSENNFNSEKKIPINNNLKPNFTFSTDYHVDLLHNSTKLIEPNERIFYENKDADKNSDSISNTKSHKTNKSHKSNHQDSEFNDYVTNSGQNLSEHMNKSINQNINNKFNAFGHNQPNQPNQPNQSNQTNHINQSNQPNQPNQPNQVAQPSALISFFDDNDNYNELPPETQLLKKLDMLRKLGELGQCGVKLTQSYSLNSDYFQMKYEYELHKNIRAKSNSINWMSSLMLNCIYGVEIMNDKYNPFELKLTGWSEQINADINNYYDVFGEIYEKYNKPGKNMSPELKLMLMIGGSAIKFHLNNTLLSNPDNFNLQMQNNVNKNIPENIEPQLLEKLRQQSINDKIRQDTEKQNNFLKSKMEEEHNLANKQVQEMMFLNQKKKEYELQELKKKKELEEFQQMKNYFEQEKMNNLNTQFAQVNNISPMVQPIGNLSSNNYANLRDSINPTFNQQQNNQQQFFTQNLNANLELDNMRRKQINEQLNNMKKDIKNNNSPNKNYKKKSIDVDTSSSENSVISDKSNETINTSETSNSNNIKKTLEKNTIKSKLIPDKSLNSKNNASTFSKRNYKRNAINIST